MIFRINMIYMIYASHLLSTRDFWIMELWNYGIFFRVGQYMLLVQHRVGLARLPFLHYVQSVHHKVRYVSWCYLLSVYTKNLSFSSTFNPSIYEYLRYKVTQLFNIFLIQTSTSLSYRLPKLPSVRASPFQNLKKPVRFSSASLTNHRSVTNSLIKIFPLQKTG